MNDLESQNDRLSEELANKVNRLKHIACDIESETKEHNRFLDTMSFDFSMARNALGITLHRFFNVATSGRGDRGVMCYMIGALVFAFCLLYYVIGSFRQE